MMPANRDPVRRDPVQHPEQMRRARPETAWKMNLPRLDPEVKIGLHLCRPGSEANAPAGQEAHAHFGRASPN
jgi:hypothetical protein